MKGQHSLALLGRQSFLMKTMGVCVTHGRLPSHPAQTFTWPQGGWALARPSPSPALVAGSCHRPPPTAVSWLGLGWCSAPPQHRLFPD